MVAVPPAPLPRTRLRCQRRRQLRNVGQATLPRHPASHAPLLKSPSSRFRVTMFACAAGLAAGAVAAAAGGGVKQDRGKDAHWLRCHRRRPITWVVREGQGPREGSAGPPASTNKHPRPAALAV